VRRWLAVATLLFGCASIPTPHEEIPVAESWSSRPRILLLGIPAPSPLDPEPAHALRVSLLHRPSGLRYIAIGESMLEPILPNMVQDVVWSSPLVTSIRLNLERFMTEGMIGVAPLAENGELMHLRYCPRDLVRAGHVADEYDRDIVRLHVEPDWYTDPEYGCLYHISP
jgi:hypothetical protein